MFSKNQEPYYLKKQEKKKIKTSVKYWVFYHFPIYPASLIFLRNRYILSFSILIKFPNPLLIRFSQSVCTVTTVYVTCTQTASCVHENLCMTSIPAYENNVADVFVLFFCHVLFCLFVFAEANFVANP